MVYGIILAAGIGERFKKTPIKPLFCIKNKPMFLYALDTFLKTKKIDKILLVINDQYKQQFQKYLTGSKYKNLLICNGCQGARWKSLINGVNYLASNFKINPTDIIITHDAARINVTPAIITNNILVASQCGYASTVLALHDSIMEFNSQAVYLERSHKYIVQTPQTFQYKYWKIYCPTVQHGITDLFTYLGLKIKKSNLVKGSLLNFKITTIEDLELI